LIIIVMGFVASFLVVFALYLVITRTHARKAEAKLDLEIWHEGQRRRAKLGNEEAWNENKRMPLD
jgi:hypothetical protein